MGWARIDDDFPNHPKVWRVGAEGVALFLEGLCHASKFLTDGLLARPEVERMRLVKRPLVVAQKLVEVGLWESEGNDFRIHDYHDYNPTSDTVRERRAATRTRVDRHRKHVSNVVTERVTDSVTTSVSNGESFPARVDARVGTGSLSQPLSLKGEEPEKGPVPLQLAAGQLRLAARDLVAEWNASIQPPLVAIDNPEPSMGRIVQAVRLRPNLEEWRVVFGKAFASDFLMGRIPGPDGKAFRLVFWWLLDGEHADKVLSGFYDNRERAKDASGDEAERKREAAIRRTQERMSALPGGAA